MINLLLIFGSLVLAPILAMLPFAIIATFKEKKEKEAQEIMNKLRGYS